MKGNARAHTTNEQYRQGYDQIDWRRTVGCDNHDSCEQGPCRRLQADGADRGQLPRAPDVLDPEPVLPLHGDLLGPDGQETEAGRR